MMTHASAVVLEPHQRDELLERIPLISRMPARDVLVFVLSFFAALRVCEIAQLGIDAMLGPRGDILGFIRIEPYMTKGSRGRNIPMHPRIKQALRDFLDTYPGADWVAISPRNHQQMKAATLARAMERIFRDAGFAGCRSHTGRASNITEMARLANSKGCSLRDVQLFAGHKRLETTANYLGSSPGVRNLVEALGTTHSNGRRINNGFKKATRYAPTATSVRGDHDARWSAGLSAAGESEAHSDGRGDAERAAARRELQLASKRKLRQNRPHRRDR